jgi:hypothetical protein
MALGHNQVEQLMEAHNAYVGFDVHKDTMISHGGAY